MKQLVVLNFGNSTVDIIPVSKKIESKYKDDFEEYIFGELDYTHGQIQYMVVNSETDIRHFKNTSC